jgi:hypothetical protein
LRDTVSNRFEEIWKRISALQTDLVSQGAIEYVDDLEGAAIKFRQFIDRVKNASYGYSGLFDAVKINEAELLKIYQYDLALLEMAEEANRAVDTVEASIGTDGLPAAIRNLKSVATKAVDAYNHRSEIVLAQ